MKNSKIAPEGSGAIMDAPITEREIAENHERYLERLALFKEFGVDQEGLRSRLLRQVDAENRRVLEIGTGYGYLTVMLGRDFDTVVSMDADADGQRIAKLNAAYNGTLDKISFVTGDAGSLPFPDASFDVVVSAFTFHHLVYPFKVIREMIRVAGRQIIISDFTPEGFDAIARIHARDGKRHDSGAGDFDIVGFFLGEHGFRVSKVEEALQTVYIARRIDIIRDGE